MSVVGFGSYGSNPLTGICIITTENHYSVYFLVLSDVTVIYPSMILTLAFYIAVLRKFIQSQRSVQANISDNKSSTKRANHIPENQDTSASVESSVSGHGQQKVIIMLATHA